MKILVAIESCERDLNKMHHVALRDTWGRDLNGWADLRFFVGRGGCSLGGDEIRLDAPDDYDGLPLKTKALAKWVVEQQYDHVFKCDTDTFVRVDLLRQSGFEGHDYTGRFGAGYNGSMLPHFDDCRLREIGPIWPYASGGVGYFLSRHACEIVSEMPLVHWAEDFCVGQVLGPRIASGELKSRNPEKFDGHVAWHYCTQGRNRAFDPRWLREAYRHGRPMYL